LHGGCLDLGVRAGIGGFKVDDVAQQDVAFVQFIAPDDNCLEGQRVFAQAGNHCFATGFNPFGDGNFALAGEKFHRAHFAQVHANRVIGTVGGFALLGFYDGFFAGFDEIGTFDLFFCFFFFHHIDAHVGKHGHGVFNLL